jgi:NTE family protein
VEWTPKDEYFMDKFIASASIPVIFPYVDLKLAKEILVDGGVRNITPLSSAFHANPDEIYILLTSRLIRDGSDLPLSGVKEQDYQRWKDSLFGTKVTGFDVLKRTVEILTDEIYLDDFRGALEWNEIAESIKALERVSRKHRLPRDVSKEVKMLAKRLRRVKKRFVKISAIAPREWYGIDNDSIDFSPKLIKWAIEHGHEVARDETLWLWPPKDEILKSRRKRDE